MIPNNLKKMIILGAIALFILVVISTLMSNMNRNQKKNEINNEIEDSNVYDFNETIDLDTENVRKEYDPEIGTDYPNLGTISDYYDHTDVFYEEDKVYIQSHDGYQVVSSEWMNEGYANEINEPEFGELEKFILSSPSITASFTGVKMRDTIDYINELSGLGFNEVVKNNRNNGADYYIYSAKNGDITVTLNYEKGKLVIMVF